MENRDRDEKSREALRADERVRYQWMLDSVSKFRLFFVGLVFAILSFSVQFSIVTGNRAAKGCQVAAWILLLATGMLSLRDAGGFVTRYTQDKFDGLSACDPTADVGVFCARARPDDDHPAPRRLGDLRSAST